MLSHSHLRGVEMLQQAASAERVAPASTAVLSPRTNNNDMSSSVVAELSSCPIWSVRVVLELTWVIPLQRHLLADSLRCVACTCN